MRNSVKTGIVVPQYVNLSLFDYGFSVTISFHIEEKMIKYLQNVIDKMKYDKNQSYYVFGVNNKKGNRLYYLGWRRTEQNLNTISSVCWREAPAAKNKLMVMLREAKIKTIEDEISNINTLF